MLVFASLALQHTWTGSTCPAKLTLRPLQNKTQDFGRSSLVPHHARSRYSRKKPRKVAPGICIQSALGFASHILEAISPASGWVVVLYGWAILTGYHYRLYTGKRKNSHLLETLSGPNIESRKLWAKRFTKSSKDTITAVQSLRNGLMIATANSSMAIALLSVCLGPLLEAYMRGSFPLLRELLHFKFPVLLDVLKFSILFGLLVMQFVCFAQCCYYWVHMTFVLPIVEPDEDKLVTTEGLADIATHAQSFWWWGYRSVFPTLVIMIRSRTNCL
mmetsp:Transcript_5090/g.12409  ORF Transcript_5090/g.12409 Transcript_5090/m.12409 type:complete len:274 (-) Transcript_5090:1-822(-)